MNCCKKEEDCCPCDKLKERIDCLQAQINELTKMDERIKSTLHSMLKTLEHHRLVKDIKIN